MVILLNERDGQLLVNMHACCSNMTPRSDLLTLKLRRRRRHAQQTASERVRLQVRTADAGSPRHDAEVNRLRPLLQSICMNTVIIALQHVAGCNAFVRTLAEALRRLKFCTGLSHCFAIASTMTAVGVAAAGSRCC